MPKRPETLQGALDLIILKTLERGPNHGFGIADHIQTATGNLLRVEEGSLYPALYRLERDKVIKVEWKITDNGRRARYYKLTKKGIKRLTEVRESWDILTKSVGKVLDLCVIFSNDCSAAHRSTSRSLKRLKGTSRCAPKQTARRECLGKRPAARRVCSSAVRFRSAKRYPTSTNSEAGGRTAGSLLCSSRVWAQSIAVFDGCRNRRDRCRRHHEHVHRSEESCAGAAGARGRAAARVRFPPDFL